eukprot:CAMPEP_0174263472 /NCGR_PEP_ID=MMETSP0439-20130205/18833_1 /TAXON_ID=0 /ORGANISM="Stereomyxa ramosa, Strain Chinc5" /LENGTH=193 /DNA_ID=CAMNT_0015348833 /DNA_START=183 /DNA_END=764 /DNA_ORIENTATION=+
MASKLLDSKTGAWAAYQQSYDHQGRVAYLSLAIVVPSVAHPGNFQSFSYDMFPTQQPGCWSCFYHDDLPPSSSWFSARCFNFTDQDVKYQNLNGASQIPTVTLHKSANQSFPGYKYQSQQVTVLSVDTSSNGDSTCYLISDGQETLTSVGGDGSLTFFQNTYFNNRAPPPGTFDVPKACASDPSCKLPPSDFF